MKFARAYARVRLSFSLRACVRTCADDPTQSTMLHLQDDGSVRGRAFKVRSGRLCLGFGVCGEWKFDADNRVDCDEQRVFSITRYLLLSCKAGDSSPQKEAGDGKSQQDLVG